MFVKQFYGTGNKSNKFSREQEMFIVWYPRVISGWFIIEQNRSQNDIDWHAAFLMCLACFQWVSL